MSDKLTIIYNVSCHLLQSVLLLIIFVRYRMTISLSHRVVHSFSCSLPWQHSMCLQIMLGMEYRPALKVIPFKYQTGWVPDIIFFLYLSGLSKYIFSGGIQSSLKRYLEGLGTSKNNLYHVVLNTLRVNSNRLAATDGQGAETLNRSFWNASCIVSWSQHHTFLGSSAKVKCPRPEILQNQKQQNTGSRHRRFATSGTYIRRRQFFSSDPVRPKKLCFG